MPSMQWPLEDSILDANFSLVDDKSFPLYKSPVATRPLSHIVDSPGRRGTPGCTKSLDFSDTKALDFGTPFSNFSTSPPSPFPAFTLPNKQPTSVTPGLCVPRCGYACLVDQYRNTNIFFDKLLELDIVNSFRHRLILTVLSTQPRVR